jgi:putative transposase
MRDGEKALKDNVAPHIIRNTSVLNVGDVLFADGHRFSFPVINPFTGKPSRAVLLAFMDWKSGYIPGYEIMFEEDTQAIASALRNSIISMKMIPKYAYQDNGKRQIIPT